MDAPPQGSAAKSLGGWLLFFIIIAGSIGGYHALDEGGYIPHTHSVELYMAGDWLVGESRECEGFENVQTQGQPPEIATLQCPFPTSAATSHTVDIKFWGRVSRPDVWASKINNFAWKCKREEGGFTCFAVD